MTCKKETCTATAALLFRVKLNTPEGYCTRTVTDLNKCGTHTTQVQRQLYGPQRTLYYSEYYRS